MSDILRRASHVLHADQSNPHTLMQRKADLVPELAAELERLYADSRLLGQANYLLAKVVAAANVGAIDGEDGFVESYNLPVGPIHKAIPFLQEQGIVITQDGQIKNGPEQSVGA